MPSNITTQNHHNYNQSDSIGFALQPIVGIKDLVVNGFSVSFIRLGREVNYQLIARNLGTESIGTGMVKFIKDSRLDFVSAVPAISNITADTLSWNFSNLNVRDTFLISVTFKVKIPPLVNLGDTLTNNLTVLPLINDYTPGNNAAVIKDRIIGAYDPNDKSEIHTGEIPFTFASSGDYLQYRIRFQNTGNDTAFNIFIKDTLDSKLDWTTVQMISTSHWADFSIQNGNELTWTFAGINLVDSNRNEPLSHGYIVYQVKPKSTIVVGDVIHNGASIYFDYNLPVETNNASTLVRNTNQSVLPAQQILLSGNRQDSRVTLYWHIHDATTVQKFEIERSTDGRSFSLLSTSIASSSFTYSYTDNISQVIGKAIYYRVKVIGINGGISYSAVLPIQFRSAEMVFNIHPNPATQNVFVSYSSKDDGLIVISIVDASGKIILRRKEIIRKGDNIIEITGFSSLPTGNYLISTEHNAELKSKWISKQ